MHGSGAFSKLICFGKENANYYLPLDLNNFSRMLPKLRNKSGCLQVTFPLNILKMGAIECEMGAIECESISFSGAIDFTKI